MHKKKLLGSALALAMVFPSSQASAELLKNLKWEGQFDFQGTSAENVTDFLTNGDANATDGVDDGRDVIATMHHRILLGLGFDLLDDVHAKMTLGKNNRVYGASAAANPRGENIDTYTANVHVDEANVKVDKLMGAVDMTLGRQFYGNEGDLVAYFGPRDNYGLDIDALDAARFDWAGEMLTASLILGKRDDSAAIGANTTNGDRDLRGLVLGLKGHENVNAGAYVWNQLTRRYNAAVGTSPDETPSGGGRNDKLWVAGLKGKLTMGGLWAGAEFAKNFGVQRVTNGSTQIAPTAKYTGWAFLADAGAKIDVDGVAAFTPWGQFGVGTGRDNTRSNENEDFQAINTDYRPGALYGRFDTNASAQVGSDFNGVASNGLTNRVIWGVGLKATPAAASKLTVGASFWDIRRHRATVGPNTPAEGDGSKTIGKELDLEASWAHSDNVNLALTLAKFMPGSFIKNQAQSTNATSATGSANSGRGINDAYMAAFDVRIKWGGQQ